jgi:hypothetical protein
MIFTRSTPERRYSDYTQYRGRLRRDFQHRCATCLTHEFFLGGEAGFQIDHYRPIRGVHARPDLESVYTNLYWACTECNQNKADIWPDDGDYALGNRFIDPCQEWGDHDLHWQFRPDGSLEALTPEGRYTERHLMLWRDFLVDRRRQTFEDQELVAAIRNTLGRKRISADRRAELTRRLTEISRRLEPPVFSRRRRRN